MTILQSYSKMGINPCKLMSRIRMTTQFPCFTTHPYSSTVTGQYLNLSLEFNQFRITKSF